MSIFNRMKKNPGMTMAGIFFVVALVVLIGWLVNRGRNKSGTGEGPQLEISGTKTVSSVKTSGYSIKYEYALGEFRGNNIDFTVNINTKGGFEENNIDSLKIIRYDGTTKLGEIEITGVKNYTEYTETFKGLDLKTDAVPATGGKNKFEVIGYEGTTAYDTDSTIAGVQPLAFTEVTINESDLNYVLSTEKTENFSFDLSRSGGATVFGVELGDITRSQYVLSIDPTKTYALIPNNGGYQFKDTSGNFLAVGDTNIFKIDKFGEKYRLYSGDMILTRTDGTGNLILKKPSEMKADEAEVALMEITQTGTYSIRSFDTPAQDDGQGAIIFLDRQNVDCGDDGINRFHYFRPTNTTIGYHVNCLEGVDDRGEPEKVTPSTDQDAGGKNFVYLDRQEVNCDDKPINRFHLRNDNGRLGYRYNCSNKKPLGSCRDVETSVQEAGGGNMAYLDRQNVQCGDGEVITKFRLLNKGNDKVAYSFRCCKMNP